MTNLTKQILGIGSGVTAVGGSVIGGKYIHDYQTNKEQKSDSPEVPVEQSAEGEEESPNVPESTGVELQVSKTSDSEKDSIERESIPNLESSSPESNTEVKEIRKTNIKEYEGSILSFDGDVDREKWEKIAELYDSEWTLSKRPQDFDNILGFDSSEKGKITWTTMRDKCKEVGEQEYSSTITYDKLGRYTYESWCTNKSGALASKDE